MEVFDNIHDNGSSYILEMLDARYIYISAVLNLSFHNMRRLWYSFYPPNS